MLAATADVSAAYALIEECSAWLRAKAILQWDPPYPRGRFEHDVASGDVWLWRGNHGITATVTLSSKRPAYYPAGVWEQATPAWYISRFAVARSFQGVGLGVQLLSELEDDARADGVAALRLDVVATNPFLAPYYEARGFVVVARAQMMGADTVFLEKALR